MEKALTYLGIPLYLSKDNISNVHHLIFRNEFWKDVVGFEGQYKISSLGRVLRLKRLTHAKRRHGMVAYYTKAKLMKINLDRAGYTMVSLSIVSKTINRTIHRLIAEAFIPNEENKREVNHKNCIKRDSRLENLEWNTHQENMRHAVVSGRIIIRKGSDNPGSKLKEDQVLEIKRMLETGLKSYREIGDVYGVDQSTIFLIKSGHNWSHLNNIL